MAAGVNKDSKEMRDLQGQLADQKDQAAGSIGTQGTDTSAATSGEAKKPEGGKKPGGDKKPKDKPSQGSEQKPGSSGSSSAASSSSSSDTGPKPKKDSVAELDDLLGGTPSKPKPKEEAKPSQGSSAPAGGSGLPDKLSREQVQTGMNAVAGNVKNCGQGKTGAVTVQAVISSAGRVTSANTTGTFAGTPEGLCAARAVRGARFPQAKNPLTVTYPFKF
jgi:hypothetical protein